jgi:DNA-binding GntR family transcriptional regulator
MIRQDSRARSDVITYGHIADAVVDRIREMILEGRVKPGEWLRQADLARELGVSAIPVREALRALESERLVVLYPMRGAMVTRLTIPEIVESDELMEELEVLACKWLAEDFSRLPMERMKQAFAGMEEAEAHHDVNQRLKMVRQFKYCLYEAPARPFLLKTISNLFDMGLHYRRIFSGLTDLSAARVEAYRRVLRACEERDLPALIAATRGVYALARKAIVAELQRQEAASENREALPPASI